MKRKKGEFRIGDAVLVNPMTVADYLHPSWIGAILEVTGVHDPIKKDLDCFDHDYRGSAPFPIEELELLEAVENLT